MKVKKPLKKPKTESRFDNRKVNKVTGKRERDYREKHLIYQDGMFIRIGVDNILNI